MVIFPPVLHDGGASPAHQAPGPRFARARHLEHRSGKQRARFLELDPLGQASADHGLVGQVVDPPAAELDAFDVSAEGACISQATLERGDRAAEGFAELGRRHRATGGIDDQQGFEEF